VGAGGGFLAGRSLAGAADQNGVPHPIHFREEGGASGVSADGRVVVGWIERRHGGRFERHGGRLAYRQTAAEPAVPLDLLPGDFSSHAHGISEDGLVVVGCTEGEFEYATRQAFRWAAGEGMTRLGALPGGCRSAAYAASRNGTVIVGESDSTEGRQAFRWTAAGGMVGLGFLPSSLHVSVGYGVSGDGSVVVGESGTFSNTQAFRWTAAKGMVGLGFLPGSRWSSAKAISADGRVVVGISGDRAFRWTEPGGMVALGNETSCANAVSRDGSVIVGWRMAERRGVWATGKDYKYLAAEAFVWDSAHGMWALASFWDQQYPYSAESTLLQSATGVSADGTTIVGEDSLHRGSSPPNHPWVVRLARPLDGPATKERRP